MHGSFGLGSGDELEGIRVRKRKVTRIYYKRKIFQFKKKEKRMESSILGYFVNLFF